MFGQPRCREWTPLATQQLRLRSLLQIVGYNMYGNECCSQPGSLYYTLHVTAMSAPFYTSEKLLSNHPKWREIDSEIIHKMSSPSVVIRVWRHIRYEERVTTEGSADRNHKQTDKIIQTWSVRFKGLLHIGANLSLNFNPKSFKDNTLIFQMYGGYFSSYDKLRLQAVPRGIAGFPYVNDTTGKEVSPSKIIPIENRPYSKGIKESKSVSPGRGNWRDESKFVSKSHSPPNNVNFRQNFSNEKRAQSSRNVEPFRSHYDSHGDSVYEHSPKSDVDFEIREYSGSEGSSDNLKSSSSLSASNRDLTSVEESETAENYEANLTPIPKYRYSSMEFLNSEIRPSYNAEKLKKLHDLQFLIKKRLQAVQELKERIYQKSAMENCENLSSTQSLADYEDFSRSENLSISSREFSFITGKSKHTKSRELGNIFSENIEDKFLSIKEPNESKEKAKEKHSFPERNNENNPYFKKMPSLYKLIDNTTATDRRFTLPLNKLLECKSKPSPSQRLKYACLTKQLELSRFKNRLLKDERDAALARIRRLKEVQTKLSEENQDIGSDLMQKYHSLSRKWEQLKELRKSGAALKELASRSEALLQARRWQLVQDIQIIYPIVMNSQGKLSILGIHLPACQSAIDGLKQVPESDLAVVLGYIAHMLALTSGILGVPLHHPLRLMGSRTKIVDHLSTPPREIPLFARNKDSMMFRFGLFLLNKNISQLLWATHRVITHDPRDTLGNLRKLLMPPGSLTSMETSNIYGSVTSMETTGAIGYGMIHPLSAPTLASTNVNYLQELVSSSSNPAVCTGAIRKAPHHSLRSLVAVGTDRSSRSIIASGGFNNTGRQFNRFKESINGHSPKDAMIMRKYRYSRSVGSYVDDQSLQNLERSPPSIIGSEPSLLIHDPNNDNQLSENDNPSDSPSDNIQNVMSFSESDLTKVSDITSPETISSVNGFSTTNDAKVIFSVGDDGQLSDCDKESINATKITRQRSFEEKPQNPVFNKNTKSKFHSKRYKPSVLSKENVEIKNLQLDVDQLSKELQQLCSNCSSDNKTFEPPILKSNANEEKSRLSFDNCSSDLSLLNISETEKPSSGQLKHFELASVAKQRELIMSPLDDVDSVQTSTEENFKSAEEYSEIAIDNDHAKSPIDSEINSGCESSSNQCLMVKNIKCNVIDIEKLDCLTYCDEPCSENCPRIFEEYVKSDTTSKIEEENESSDEAMQDVIVLPSAEAASSSYFTDSLRLLDVDSENVIQKDMENFEHVDNSSLGAAEFDNCIGFESDRKGMQSMDAVNLSLSRAAYNMDDADHLIDCNVQISDSALISEGNSASRDANELLESLKLIENTEFVPKISQDIAISALLNTTSGVCNERSLIGQNTAISDNKDITEERVRKISDVR